MGVQVPLWAVLAPFWRFFYHFINNTIQRFALYLLDNLIFDQNPVFISLISVCL